MQYKTIKKICEILLFFLMGNLTRIAFSMQLNYIDNIILLACVLLLVLYILIVNKSK